MGSTRLVKIRSISHAKTRIIAPARPSRLSQRAPCRRAVSPARLLPFLPVSRSPWRLPVRPRHHHIQRLPHARWTRLVPSEKICNPARKALQSTSGYRIPWSIGCTLIVNAESLACRCRKSSKPSGNRRIDLGKSKHWERARTISIVSVLTVFEGGELTKRSRLRPELGRDVAVTCREGRGC